MDAQYLADRTNAMCGIHVAPVLLVVIQPPVVPIFIPEGIQVMAVGPFDVDDLTEKTAPGHFERSHLEKVIDTVLEHHAMLSRLLGLVDQAPDFIHVQGGGHFYGYVLATLHRIHCDGIVVKPVRTDIHQIDVLLFAEAAPGFLFAAVAAGRGRLAHTGQVGLAGLDPVGKQVAQGCHHGAGYQGEAFYAEAAAHSQADHADADGLDRLSRQAQCTLLPGGPGRDIRTDDVVR